MSQYDNGFARAQAAYDRQEPPDHSGDRCYNTDCNQTLEEHEVFTFEGRDYTLCESGVSTIRDIINDSGYLFNDEDPGPDPDRARDEAIDREFDDR